MLFEPIALKHKSLVEEYIRAYDLHASEFSFTTMFMWGANEQISICCENNVLYILLKYEGYEPYMFTPLLKNREGDFKQAFTRAVEYLRSLGATPRFRAISGVLLEYFKQIEGGTLSEDRANFDYVYSAESLRTLKGKKLHSKRNHVNQFMAKYADRFIYRPLKQSDVDACIALYSKWISDKKMEDNADAVWEKEALIRVVSNMEALGLSGGAIIIDGELAAYTVGELKGNGMAIIHVEKAASEMVGLYTQINQQYAQNALADADTINREEDMGIEGLRRAKLSYNPVYMIEKYVWLENKR